MRYLASRALQGLVVIFTVLVVVFFAIRIVGDPVDILLPLDASDETRERVRDQLGLNEPLVGQFGEFVTEAVQLDFGESYSRGTDALAIVTSRFANTVALVTVSMVLAIVIGLGVGVIAALRPDGLIDRSLVALSLISVSVPQFWLGLVLILTFAVGFGALPSAGTGSFKHLVLPAITLALPPAGRFGVMARRALRDEMEADYVRLDYARGLPRRVAVIHALRASSITVISVVGYEIVYTFAGHSVVVETVFAWPGIGALVTEALELRDLPLIQAVVGFIAVLVVLLNFTLDMVYYWIDPRISLEQSAGSA